MAEWFGSSDVSVAKELVCRCVQNLPCKVHLLQQKIWNLWRKLWPSMWIPSLAWGQQIVRRLCWMASHNGVCQWLERDTTWTRWRLSGQSKKGLTKQQERTLKKASTNSKKASLEQKTQYKVVAGDNQAESLISSVKLQLRRSNRVGRGSPKLAHVDQLAALRMLNAPGLSNLLTAVANYRKARCNQMGCSPKDFFNLDTDEKWLWE